MMSSTLTPPLPAAIPPEPITRISVDQYHAMIEVAQDDRVELVEGWLFPKPAKTPAHRKATRFLRKSLEQMVPSGWDVDSQEPITTIDSEPEPDVSVVRGGAFERADRHPGPNEVALVIEVAESTLARDRGIKKRIYARAGVPVYWIVNLVDSQVEVYTAPTGPGENPDYAPMQVHKRGDSVSVVLDGKEVGKIDVNQILP